MDKEKLMTLIQGNAQLREMLARPQIQQFMHELLEDELTFESLKARFSNTSSQGGRNNRRNSHHNSKQSASAGFQNPNLSPLSPLEIKVIEGVDSEEQQFLRLLLDLLQQA